MSKIQKYSETFVKRPLKIDKTRVLMTNGSLMKVESIAQSSHWSILQYFLPALSDNWSWNQFIFYLFESGRFTQALLYIFLLKKWKFIHVMWKNVSYFHLLKQ